jgi:anionic cell wall polymer biosynthesis LytR-Cps2A-Psr (LCP) family protein
MGFERLHCLAGSDRLDFPWMREFQDYTETSHAARWRRVIWWLPTGLVVALMVALGVWVGALPTASETLGYGPKDSSGGDRGGSSGAGWLPGVLVGSREVSDGPLNVLVVGVDRRPPGSKEAQVDGVRTDTMMLVQVVPETGRVKLLSIPRDLLVEIEPGVEDRINAAYA